MVAFVTQNSIIYSYTTKLKAKTYNIPQWVLVLCAFPFPNSLTSSPPRLQPLSSLCYIHVGLVTVPRIHQACSWHRALACVFISAGKLLSQMCKRQTVSPFLNLCSGITFLVTLLFKIALPHKPYSFCSFIFFLSSIIITFKTPYKSVVIFVSVSLLI